MRSMVVLTFVLATLPALAGEGAWNLDIHRIAPTLEGHYKGTQDGKPADFDLVGDLGLQKDKTQLGVGLEYQGPRFALELGMDTQNYLGHNTIQRDVTISGQTWNAQATVDTAIKMTNYTANWTIRFMRSPGFWLGLDLGAKATLLDLHASGNNYLVNTPATAAFKSGLPMPQVGPSAGYTGLDGKLALRGYYHFLAYKGASYHHSGADLRFFPLPWLGARAFFARESWKVPTDSVAKDLAITLDRSGAGFGVVLKF
jgi:hypothetical protein